ncbi:MAG: hypothetical protein PUE84_10090 [Firmicutes bacterium]|nr:hypothetical protein [Bacillota bacterium]
MKKKFMTCRTVLRRCTGLVPVNRQGMEMVQVAILVAIAVTLGLVFKSQIGDFVDNTFSSLSNAKF